MNRRQFMGSAARAAPTTAAPGMGPSIACRRSGRTAATPDRPNIILFVADDLGWKDLGCYGDRQVRTPQLDALAADGVRFTHGFVAASSCSPSHASIVTGQYPHTNGVTGLTHVRSCAGRGRSPPDRRMTILSAPSI